ncbi:reverse transcriptase domain-containing protein [Phytobacter ursingii]|uniref:Reverse transcriptase domain-containing protein n=1 Tax=Phytobacter ursingii TaxID=1972431 RepID=A0AB35RIW6_9ENTR|nr:reverse transcriptase domain-containing protein [Phytobacter ursingii]MDV2861668.1 reverse transcriptase domain-containing protein [Phytobacter ursingii]
MNLEQLLSETIKEEAKKLIDRYHAYHNRLHLEHVRNRKRFGHSYTKKKEVHIPDYWAKDKKFNPFHVLRKHKSIAHSIAKNIENRTYKPGEVHLKKIPKRGGGERTVSIYQIPDAAVSKLFFNRLLEKNKHRFSSFSYAYRNDRNVHFAIQDIFVDLSLSERMFIAEFDFSDFFGTIEHRFLYEQFQKNGFYISQEEKYIIRAFLLDRKVGIPQGTSISLFLANLCCWNFDQALEREGVKFSRYADDTIVWTRDYSKICNAFNLITEFSKNAGVRINVKKSDGISLLTKDGLKSEIVSKKNLDFLGYSLSVDKVSIKSTSIVKIKKQISYLLYRNLIQPLKNRSLAGQSIPANDKDENFLRAMVQIRRYMYGGLQDSTIKNFLSGRSKRIFFKGVMSFYPLVTDEQQLRELDGWLVSVIYRSLKLRSRLLNQHGYNRNYNFPFKQLRDELVPSCARIKINGKKLLEIPSFLLISKALRKGLVENGIERVMNPNSQNYNYRW